jgi:hypothetical protein
VEEGAGSPEIINSLSAMVTIWHHIIFGFKVLTQKGFHMKELHILNKFLGEKQKIIPYHQFIRVHQSILLLSTNIYVSTAEFEIYSSPIFHVYQIYTTRPCPVPRLGFSPYI